MNNPPEPYDAEKHDAWLASLTPDEMLTVHMPSGYKLTFIVAALTKRGLLTDGIKPADRLLLLEKLNGLTDQYFTPEMLATIEPMGDTEYEIFREARSLDAPGDKTARAGLDLLSSPRVFWHLATLNPSILATIKLREQQYNRGAPVTAPEVAQTVEHAASAPRVGYGHDVPDRFWPQRDRQNFAHGSPGHPAGGIDPFAGT